MRLPALDPGEQRVLWFLFVLAWVLRIVVAVEYEHRHPLADRPVIDEASYEDWAVSVAGGDWRGDEVFFQEPLYPYWLGSVFFVFHDRTPARTAVRQIQCLYGAITVLLVYGITRRLFGRRAAFVAGLGLATYGPLLLLPSYLLKPNLLLPVLSGLVLLLLTARAGSFERPRSLGPWIGAGLLAAAGALLRGNMLLLLPVFLAVPLLRRFPPASSAAMGLGMLLLLLPVALRNQAVGGVFALTTSGAGTNVYGGNNEENFWGVATELAWIRGIPEHEFDDWKHEAERRTGRALDAGEVSRFWLGEAWRSFRAQPGLHLRILLNKLWLTLGRYEVPDNHHLGWDARYVWSSRLFPGYWLWGWLGLAGAFLFVARRQARDPRGAGEVLLLYLLYLATIVLTVTSMRVRLGLVPLLLPFAGHFVAAFDGRAWRRHALSLAAAAPLVWWIPFDAGTRARELDERDFNHAVYLLEDADFERADAVAVQLELRYPGTPRLVTLRAEIAANRALALLAAPDVEAAERDRAIDEVRAALVGLRAIVTDPATGARERFRARKLAGFIQLEIDRDPDAAERHFRAALEFDPADAEILEALERARRMRAD